VLDSLDGSAPSEIASAIHTQRTAVDEAAAQAASATSVEQLAGAFGPLSDPSVAAAGTTVSAYAQSSCGIGASSST
jgi:hypothetical protein